MKSNLLERRLLTVYRQAIRQDRCGVAEHLLSAIEACAAADAAISDAVAEAYGDIAARAMTSEPVPATRVRPGT